MSLFGNDGNTKEKRKSERFKSGIPVLIQKKEKLGTCECTLLSISMNGFSVRLEYGKLNLNLEEEFFLMIDPKLFNIDDKIDKIQINSMCKRIEPVAFVYGAIFYDNADIIIEYIELIVNCFKKINENEY